MDNNSKNQNNCNCNRGHRNHKSNCGFCYYCPPGPTGIPGVEGATGPIGPQGTFGTTGPAGPPGTLGATGPDGPIGPPGNAGATGLAGPQGPEGLPGSIGVAGVMGASGPQGATGTTGPTGPTGLPGPITDITGPTGPQGPPGTQGEAGWNQFAYFYALNQNLGVEDKVSFIERYNTGTFDLINNGTEIQVRTTGYYFISCAWSATDEGALSMVLAINNEKIPVMNYVIGEAQNDLVSVIPGGIIVNLLALDIISIINYEPNANLSIPLNNTPEGTPSNAAATIAVILLDH